LGGDDVRSDAALDRTAPEASRDLQRIVTGELELVHVPFVYPIVRICECAGIAQRSGPPLT
jgi:hypothetical protein